MPDFIRVTVTTVTEKTFDIEPHELAEREPAGGGLHTLADLHTLAMDLAERLRIDEDVDVKVTVDRDAADLLIDEARRLVADTD